MTRPQFILDCETTSLKPDYETGSGVIWELAVISREDGIAQLWRMKPDLTQADPSALAVGRYYERTGDMCRRCQPDRVHDLTLNEDDDAAHWSGPEALAAHVAPLLSGATLVAANPSFDAGFLTAFLNTHGQAATWHYRLRDIGSMAWAWLQAHRLPHHLGTPAMDAGTDDLARAMGVDPDGFERHSALGDCRLVAAMLDVIEGGSR